MSFRRAQARDREWLNELTLAGTRHWGHDVNHPEAYQDLVSTLAQDEGPEGHHVYILGTDGEDLGFFDLRLRDGHVELVRMFLNTDLIGQGYGRLLWDEAVAHARDLGDRMLIMSDPRSVGFYEAMGAELETQLEVAPGFTLGQFWYDLR